VVRGLEGEELAAEVGEGDCEAPVWGWPGGKRCGEEGVVGGGVGECWGSDVAC
jgi:hypothetical protein